ncbi:hypothetical protein FT663_02242 [Candidozyma haemuli var. vulneris]|uniref:Uncharacterized protein n=1 Tax=Candidozyma haemuli TaxID=45357 RepID=A0A2V1ATS0_9ASCO|nr:hypothetical protein CXQ85_000198 [[Candida] haemuloni]KAF3992589.1 hypothetical protein FT663_02242 [[Candida] haemuloni var. vulneris]KAF3992641.1 hypothetical protein FT662_01022 [[Candida] haemuloni var. vulneris]PVH21229.1 hypothetical protein CXQ85_000198 [[Candida] haemuloni]
MKSSSVILPESGQKVYRSNSFFNNEFESFNDDSFQDSEYSESMASGVTGPRSTRRRWSYRIRRLRSRTIKLYRNEVFRNVLKCSIAYLVASMGVYWTRFDNFLGVTDSKHVVATTAVYFHPARTKGSMHQSIMFVLISLSFSFLVSLTCRATSTFFFNNGEDEISFGIDLIISSIGLAVIAFMKQKVNKQTFNTACSLASISLITCIVKEGALNSSVIPMRRLLSTSQVVFVGSCVSVASCYLLWPRSAVSQLRKSLNDNFNIMSSLVSITTHRFLSGEKLTQKDTEIFGLLSKKCSDLRGSLEEAGYELRFVGKEAEYASYTQIVDATISLSRHLQALRSSLEMQWQLLHGSGRNSPKQAGAGGAQLDTVSSRSLDSYHTEDIRLSSSVENLSSLNASERADHPNDTDQSAMYSNQLFDLFVYYLAPSIKSFVFTVKEVLSAVPFEHKYVGDKEQDVFVKSSNYQNSLVKALELFQSKQTHSFGKLYSQEIFKPDNIMFKTDQEEVTACCGNFASLLALYGEELIRFLQLTEHFEVVAKAQPRSWSYLKFWKTRSIDKKAKQNNYETDFVEALREFKAQFSPLTLRQPTETTGLITRKEKVESFRRKLWESLYFFRRIDIQFGLRVGVGAFCISLFAFLPQTKEIFVTWRLEWTLVIYCIMMSKSLGGTTMTAKWRFVGTFLGAFIAWVVWESTGGNVYALATTGFLLSIPCFYIIIYWKKNNPFGRFILLTYNLTALYSYSMTQNDSEDGNEGGEEPIVGAIAYHRFVSVSIGILWALFVATCFLPNSARKRLKSGLTVLWLRMGVIWNSDPLEFKSIDDEPPRLVGLKDYKGTSTLFLECQTLLKQAPLELRLKGSLPKATYEELLKSTSNVLDAFQNIKLMVEVDPCLTPNEVYVLKYIENEREELEHRIFLIFYMIASALALGFPLPSKPASTEHARNRMLLKLSEVRSKSVSENLKLSNEDYVLLYSYLLVTSTITKELDRIIELIKQLLGGFSEEIFYLV